MTTVTRPQIEAAADAAGWDTDASDGNYLYGTKGAWFATIVFETTNPYRGKPVSAVFTSDRGTITVGANVLDEVVEVLTHLGA